jgi:hypothetical protein
MWENPVHREAQNARLKSEWADPAIRAKRVKGLTRAWADPETRAKRVEAIREGIIRREAKRREASQESL